MKDRRYRIQFVEESVLIDILNGRVTVADFDVPDDAMVVGAYQDFARDAFGFVIESAAFESVPLGEMIPLLPPFRVIRKRS